MHEATLQAFADELAKIAGIPKGMLEASGKGASKDVQTYLHNRLSAHVFGQRASARMPRLWKRLETRSWGKISKKKARQALSDGEKRATMVKYTGPHHLPHVKTAGELARKTNAIFGLPLTGKKHVRRYENGPSAAQSADASQYPVAGMATPNISASNVMSPAYGPGGV